MKKRKPLKVAVVVGVFPSVSEAFITNQLRFLVKSGHHVDILATRYLDLDNPLFSSEAYNSLKTKARELSKASLLPKTYFRRLFKAFSILLKFRSTIHLLKAFNVFKYGSDALNFNVFFKTYYKYYFNIHNYDVVHIHYGDNAVHLDSLINNFKKITVVTFHGYDAHKFDKSFYSTLSQRKDITITVNTNFTKSKVEKLGFDASQINILPVGLDTNIFNPEKENNKVDNTNILFVGRLIELKGPILAIKIVEKILEVRENVIFNIIGDGPMFSECESYIERNNLADRINLLGSKSQSDIKDYMNESDIFLFPGIVDGQGNSEAQGLVIQEAQAIQLPVVTSSIGGISDGLIDEKTGFLIEEGNVDAFVSKLLWLIDNPDIRQEMGEAGRHFVVENYDSAILGEKLLDIYYNSLNN